MLPKRVSSFVNPLCGLFPLAVEAKLRMRRAASGRSAAAAVNMDNVETMLPLLSKEGALVLRDFPTVFAVLSKDQVDSTAIVFEPEHLEEAQHAALRSTGPFTLISFLRVFARGQPGCVAAVYQCA